MARLGVSVSNLFRDESRGKVQGAWGVHPSSPPPPPQITCGFLIQLVLCIKICLRHQSVTLLLSGASPRKKNPGSAPSSIISCNHLMQFFF